MYLIDYLSEVILGFKQQECRRRLKGRQGESGNFSLRWVDLPLPMHDEIL